MEMTVARSAFLPTDAVRRVRDRLDHPVIDSDGHLIEFMPMVRDHVVELGGESMAATIDAMVGGLHNVGAIPAGAERRAQGRWRSPWWGVPTANTLDRATGILPGLLYRRLEEIGIDFALLYPTYGLTVTALPFDEPRRCLARAFNRYYAEAYEGFRDRLEPVACIPCFTPEEAVDELEYAVGELGLKAVMLAGVIGRPLPGAEDQPAARWIDTLAHDSPFDYDPLWAACDRLGVAPTFHASGMGWGSRTSTSNYMYNHIGNFAAAGEAIARSLFFGGVPRRFPNLRFAFQEGGVAWACNLFSDILGHWGKRNRDAIRHYDPAALDRTRLETLFAQFAEGRMAGQAHRLDYGLRMLSDPDDGAPLVDEFADSLVERPEDVLDIFTRQFHFGCEADDPMNAMAFDERLNPMGARLRGLFASDIGHWDVPDFGDVLPEAYELVTEGCLTEEDFQDLVFTNPISLWSGANPSFFTDTAVGDAVERRLGTVTT